MLAPNQKTTLLHPELSGWNSASVWQRSQSSRSVSVKVLLMAFSGLVGTGLNRPDDVAFGITH